MPKDTERLLLAYRPRVALVRQCRQTARSLTREDDLCRYIQVRALRLLLHFCVAEGVCPNFISATPWTFIDLTGRVDMRNTVSFGLSQGGFVCGGI